MKKFCVRGHTCACGSLKMLRLNLRKALALAIALVFSFTPVVPNLSAAPAPAKPPVPAGESGEDDHGCNLGGQVKHVIYLQFDNVHFRRDNPNVPSDLEQMPHLLNFLTNNGTLLTNNHTPLISHTADDIITSLTGVYGDRHGGSVANSFGIFNPPGSKYVASFSSTFTYWTDPVGKAGDVFPIMLAANGKNAPAPWVAWTRAGCNVGAFSTANIELENTHSDIQKVFANDPTALAAALAEANSSDPLMQDKAVADYEGIAIHCAKGSELCSTANNAEPDLLPDEPGGYDGFRGLFGNKYVAPVISPGKVINDLDGNPIEDTDAPNAHLGFPGFDPTASQALAYVATMQEAGVPVTYAYIADAHDNHTFDWAFPPAICGTDAEQGALGPGDACYEAQLASYDAAFGKFFARLESDGITKNNTLFVVTSDEGDHFAGGAPDSSSCNGTIVACTYSKLGEIDADIADLLSMQNPGASFLATPFDIHFDMAPTFYIGGDPAATDPAVRGYERAVAKLTAVSPITGNTDKLTRYLADTTEEKLLHMITADPQRTPNFTMFGDPDYYFVTYQPGPAGQDLFEDSGYAWNHGGVAPEINTTWLGLVGPGVKVKGMDAETWADHTDIRPTMLVLAGVQDDYQHEGRALVEDLEAPALPNSLTGSSGVQFEKLAQAFKQINAPVGPLGLASLRVSTKALASGTDSNDSKYTSLENKLTMVTNMRDALASNILAILESAEFNNTPVSAGDATTLASEASQLLEYVEELAGE